MTPRPPPPPDAPNALPEDDESIPLLTEVVELPTDPDTATAIPVAQPDWPDIARQVQARVAARLAERGATLFDGELQSLLDPVVDRAIRQFSAQVEAALREVAGDLVARAVAEEMARAHDEIARGEFPPASTH